LSIVSAAMRLLPQHHLRLTSQVDAGTSFSLTLPPAQTTPALAELKGGLAQPLAQQLAGCYVLVVEDDYLVRESLVYMLNAFQILTDAYSSVDALQKDIANIERTPDGVICDYRLPDGRTAHDVVQLILTQFDNVPFLTVSAERLDAADFRCLDIVAVCAKPINAEDLIKALAELMSRGAAKRSQLVGPQPGKLG